MNLSGLIKGVSKTTKNEAKEQNNVFLSLLLGTLGSSLLGNLLTGKEKIRAGEGAIRISRGRGTIRAGREF